MTVVFNLQNDFMERKTMGLIGGGYESLEFKFVERGGGYVRQQKRWLEDMKRGKAWL